MVAAARAESKRWVINGPHLDLARLDVRHTPVVLHCASISRPRATRTHRLISTWLPAQEGSKQARPPDLPASGPEAASGGTIGSTVTSPSQTLAPGVEATSRPRRGGPGEDQSPGRDPRHLGVGSSLPVIARHLGRGHRCQKARRQWVPLLVRPLGRADQMVGCPGGADRSPRPPRTGAQAVDRQRRGANLLGCTAAHALGVLIAVRAALDGPVRP